MIWHVAPKRVAGLPTVYASGAAHFSVVEANSQVIEELDRVANGTKCVEMSDKVLTGFGD
jgi:hypothetical protein